MQPQILKNTSFRKIIEQENWIVSSLDRPGGFLKSFYAITHNIGSTPAKMITEYGLNTPPPYCPNVRFSPDRFSPEWELSRDVERTGDSQTAFPVCCYQKLRITFPWSSSLQLSVVSIFTNYFCSSGAYSHHCNIKTMAFSVRRTNNSCRKKTTSREVAKIPQHTLSAKSARSPFQQTAGKNCSKS